MAKAKVLKNIRAHKTSPGGRNHAHHKKAHEDTIGVPKWGAVWKPKSGAKKPEELGK